MLSFLAFSNKQREKQVPSVVSSLFSHLLFGFDNAEHVFLTMFLWAILFPVNHTQGEAITYVT